MCSRYKSWSRTRETLDCESSSLTITRPLWQQQQLQQQLQQMQQQYRRSRHEAVIRVAARTARRSFKKLTMSDVPSGSFSSLNSRKSCPPPPHPPPHAEREAKRRDIVPNSTRHKPDNTTRESDTAASSRAEKAPTHSAAGRLITKHKVFARCRYEQQPRACDCA